MKARLVLLFLFSITMVHGQNSLDIIPIGSVDTLYSKILGEERKIWVHLPRESGDEIYGRTNYPVVYLLDGDAYFHSVTAMVEELSRNSLCPKMIVVGILNTDRLRDLTPSHSLQTYDGRTNASSSSGGADQFTSFIEKELIPHIDSLYPTTPHRMLIGHSFGGLMVLNTLMNHSHLFSSYVAIDPSLWWDNRKLLMQVDSSVTNSPLARTLYIGIANPMIAGMDFAQVKKDTSGSSLHTRSIFELTEKLRAHPDQALRWSYKYYQDDDHGSVPLITTYDALRFIFDYYKFKGDNKDVDLIAHFENVSGRMGYKVPPPEAMVNSMGYSFMQKKMFDQAQRLFKLNIENYPQSFNVYDSMGEYYETMGNKEKAIQHYTMALGIKDFPYTRKKLDKLKAEK